MERDIYEDEERERKVVKETKKDMIKFICMFNYSINEEDLENKNLTYIRDLYNKTKAERRKRTKLAYENSHRYEHKARRPLECEHEYDDEENYENTQGPIL